MRTGRSFGGVKLVAIIVGVVLVAASIFVFIRNRDESDSSSPNSQETTANYINFSGGYVFGVPKDFTVDEQSVLGAQLLYRGTIEARTLEDVYNSNGIAVQEISNLSDKSGNGFKKYVNETFVPEMKQNLSVEDVEVKFGNSNNQDNARVTARKDGKFVRFVYIKGGQHPAQIVANTETDELRLIAETIKDVESSELKDEAEPLKQALLTTAQLIKDKKAQELYDAAASELRSQNTLEELTTALEAATTFTTGNISISGGSSSDNEFTAAMRFSQPDQADQVAIGSMVLNKIDGQWKLALLTLPTPTQ